MLVIQLHKQNCITGTKTSAGEVEEAYITELLEIPGQTLTNEDLFDLEKQDRAVVVIEGFKAI